MKKIDIERMQILDKIYHIPYYVIVSPYDTSPYFAYILDSYTNKIRKQKYEYETITSFIENVWHRL